MPSLFVAGEALGCWGGEGIENRRSRDGHRREGQKAQRQGGKQRQPHLAALPGRLEEECAESDCHRAIKRLGLSSKPAVESRHYGLKARM